ncbi:MAG: hypothetical protein HKN12_05300 [Gemmatimonadetes bacterium]|nr:hypothetical protein [Gemmatimonadota bacterium]
MYSTEKSKDPGSRIPLVLLGTTLALLLVIGIPTALIAGAETVRMMAIGAALAFTTVLAGYGFAKLAFRGPDPFASKIMVGGFLIRMILLIVVLSVFVKATGLDLGQFIFWVITFYFALVMAEAWILARAEMRERAS